MLALCAGACSRDAHSVRLQAYSPSDEIFRVSCERDIQACRDEANEICGGRYQVLETTGAPVEPERVSSAPGPRTTGPRYQRPKWVGQMVVACGEARARCSGGPSRNAPCRARRGSHRTRGSFVHSGSHVGVPGPSRVPWCAGLPARWQRIWPVRLRQREHVRAIRSDRRRRTASLASHSYEMATNVEASASSRPLRVDDAPMSPSRTTQASADGIGRGVITRQSRL